MKYIHLIRHGMTEANVKNMYYGHSDLPLIDAGVSGIKASTEEGIYPVFDDAVYYTSGLLRTEQTLALIYGERPHIKLGGLKEINFGKYELMIHDDLKEDPEYIIWVEDNSGNLAPPGGESLADFKERVMSCFEIILDADKEHSVVVCHGGVICVIMSACFDETGENMFRWIPDPGHGYSVTIEGGHAAGYRRF